MRYLVRARVKPSRMRALWKAIKNRTLGQGSVAGDEYLRNMQSARLLDNGQVCWVEICYCSTPLLEEREYWEEYFQLDRIKDAHNRRRCRDWNGTEAWSCSDCDCTARLEARMESWGRPFLLELKQRHLDTAKCYSPPASEARMASEPSDPRNGEFNVRREGVAD